DIPHRLPQDHRVVASLDAHIVAGRVDPLDRIDIDPEDLALVADVDHLLEPRRSRALGDRVGHRLPRCWLTSRTGHKPALRASLPPSPPPLPADARPAPPSAARPLPPRAFRPSA